MKLLFCNENRAFGGAEKYCLQLAKQLAARGIEVHYLLEKDSWLDQNCNLPKHFNRFRGELDIPSAWRLWRLISKERFEVVVTQAERDLAALALARRGGLRVAHLHHQHVYLGAQSGWLKRCYRRCHHLVAVSDHLQQQMQSHLGALPISVIHNAVDPLQSCDALPLAPGRWIGNLTSFYPGKGQDQLCRLLAPWLEQRPQLHLVLGGEGPQRAQLMSNYPTVHMPGFIVNPASLLPQLEVVVLASQAETFSLLAAEAMLAGKPVVAYAAGGICEVVRHGQTGCLVPLGDETALLDAVAAYLDNPQLAKEHGECGRETALARFGWPQILGQWIEMLHSLRVGRN